jgi:hypothetical protein
MLGHLNLALFLHVVDRFEVIVGAVRFRGGSQVQRGFHDRIEPFWQRRYSIRGVMLYSLPAFRSTAGPTATVDVAGGRVAGLVILWLRIECAVLQLYRPYSAVITHISLGAAKLPQADATYRRKLNLWVITAIFILDSSARQQ